MSKINKPIKWNGAKMIETDESKWTDLFFEIITCVCVCVSLSSSSSAMLFSVRTFYCFFSCYTFQQQLQFQNGAQACVLSLIYFSLSTILMTNLSYYYVHEMVRFEIKNNLPFFAHCEKAATTKKKQHKGDVKCNDNENTRQYKNVIGEYGRAVCVWMQFICCYTEEGTKKM